MAAERLTFLFWNVQGKPLEATLRRLITLHDVDVLLLAESTIASNALEPLTYCTPKVAVDKDRLRLFVRRDGLRITSLEQALRYSIWRLIPEDWEEMLLVGVHLPSKLHHKAGGQRTRAVEVSQALDTLEQESGHRRSLLMGDLNMNPFEEGLVAADALHAISSWQIAQQETRSLDEREYPFFYNPMWSLLGDRSQDPPGTFYRRDNDGVCYFWNLFDQALLRPALLKVCTLESCEILTGDGEEKFLTRTNHPDKTRFSDHLPILVRLKKEANHV